MTGAARFGLALALAASAAAAFGEGAADPADFSQNGRTIRIVDERFRPPSDFRGGRRGGRRRFERFLVRNKNGVWVETARTPRMAPYLDGARIERRGPEYPQTITFQFPAAAGEWTFAEPFEGRIQMPPGVFEGLDPRGEPVSIEVAVREIVASLEMGQAREPLAELRLTAGLSRELVLRVRSVRTGDVVDWNGEYYLQIEGADADAFAFADGRQERTVVVEAGAASISLSATEGGAAAAELAGFDPSRLNPRARPGALSGEDPISGIRVPLRRIPRR